MRKIFLNDKSNCGTTLQKIFNPYKEQVYKLNLENNIRNNSLNNSLKIQKYEKSKYSRVLEMNELLNSIEKIKKFLPKGTKLINYKNNYKIEDKLFKRFEHQEYENILKEKMKNNQIEKEKIKNELNRLRNELKDIEDDISDTVLDLNIFKDVNKFLFAKNEERKKFRRKSKLFKSLKLNNKLFEDDELKNGLNNSSNSKENNTPKNKTNLELDKKIFNFHIDSYNINDNENDNDFSNFKNFNSYNSFQNNYNNDLASNINNLKIISYVNKNKNTQMYNLSNKISFLKNKKNKIIQQIKTLDEEKRKINLENEDIKNNLYNHYLEILKEGEDTRTDGLSWAIKEIFSLGKNVLISYMPKFLDEYAIAFLFKQAKIYGKLDIYEQKIINIKKELARLGIVNNVEKTENIWKKVEGTEFLGNDFKKTYSKELISNKFNHNIKDKYLLKSIFNKRFLNKKNNNNANGIINFDSKNSISTTRENSFNKNNIKNILCSPLKNIKKINISRNLSNLSNNSNKKILSFSMRKSYILNMNLKEVQKYKHNLTLGEIQKLLKDTKIKVDQKCVKKISEYMKLNKEKKILNKLLNEMKNNEIERIFDEYSKRSYFERFMVEKDVVLSALIGEDSLIELNKQLRNGKVYFNEKYQLNKGVDFNSIKTKEE